VTIMDIKKYIGQEINVLIDRPKGTSHPNYPTLIYELNYGYVPGTVSGDGEEIDCYLLDIDFPTNKAKGLCVGIVMREDGDHKLIIISNPTRKFSVKTIWNKVRFQEQFFYPSKYIAYDFSEHIFSSNGVKKA